jgi:hypothetical protein
MIDPDHPSAQDGHEFLVLPTRVLLVWAGWLFCRRCWHVDDLGICSTRDGVLRRAHVRAIDHTVKGCFDEINERFERELLR